MGLTDEQRALRQTVRSLLARQYRPALRYQRDQSDQGSAGDQGGRSDEQEWRLLWPRLCAEVGIAGLAIPERYGGDGAGAVETHVVAEELGRALTPAPLLGSAVLAAQAILATGDGAACERLLPAIAGGTAIAALAWTAEAGHWDPAEVAFRAAPAGDDEPGGAGIAGTGVTGTGTDGTTWVLDGTAHYVLDGDHADVLVTAARTAQGIGLFEVDPDTTGVRRTAVTSMDPAIRLAVVELAGPRAGASADAATRRWPGPVTWPASRSAPSRWARPSGRWN